MTLNVEKIHIKWKSGLQILSCLEENDLGMAVGKGKFFWGKKKKIGQWKAGQKKEVQKEVFNCIFICDSPFLIPHKENRNKENLEKDVEEEW